MFRFEGTISAQFYGHTHNDEFMVFYDEVDKNRAVSMGFVTPSVTTWTGAKNLENKRFN